MEIIKLQAAAKLIYQLGEQLIENELVALLELIKNSYDADATFASISVDTEIMTPYGRGKIIIEDNGHGMLPSILKNSFFKIATNFREVHKESLKFNRQVLGEKGLGRLSFQRLGHYITVKTKADLDAFKENNLLRDEDIDILLKTNASELKIDWTKLNTEMSITDVTANLEHNNSDEKNSFTRIEIDGIRNIEFWKLSKKNIKLLVDELYKMSSPFDKLNNSNNDELKDLFKIFFSLNGNSYSNTEVDEEVLEFLADNTIEFSYENSILKINTIHYEKYIEKLINNRTNKMQNFRLVENKLNDTKLLQNFKYTSHKIDFKEKVQVEYEKYFKKIVLNYIDGGLANPGNFSGKLYNLSLTQENKSLITESIRDLKLDAIKSYNDFTHIWSSLQGFYIFRNGFRILPYGNSNYDWAGFDVYSQKTKYIPYQSKSILGYIKLDSPTCRNLREQTNRQGFILDEYGENFLNIIKHGIVTLICDEIRDIIAGFEIKGNLNDDEIVTRNGLLKFERIKSSEEEIEEAMKEIQSALEGEENNESTEENDKLEESTGEIVVSEISIGKTDEKNKNKRNKKIGDALKKIKKAGKKQNQHLRQTIEIQEKVLDDVKDVLPMVGQSIIMESMTHEFNRIVSNIRGYASSSRKKVKEGNIEKREILRWQNNIITEIRYLEEQLDHLEPMYKKNKKLIEDVDIKKILEEIYIDETPMSKKAKKANILVEVRGDSFRIKINRGYLVTIFDNLFLNSLYWVMYSNEEQKKIIIEISDKGEVVFYDNGPGISKNMEIFLFQPFQTAKEGGRGLGLYISQALLAESNGKLSMLTERNDTGRLYKFYLKFNKHEMEQTLF
ncbi:ATP-binding protein [Psychrilyobacter atlanticus]|uniref:ATP-binding protein n=1 Tax=Psychrilyobacter atlanticus TaxID=271091 RepID=UPI000403AC40|nr:sensor histidine kinase [Psychrilyobacter atlanticus]